MQTFANRLIYISRMICRLSFALGLASVISYNIRPILSEARGYQIKYF